MTKKFNNYIGKAGHLAAMSEFLMRGWNVAIPEVDTGDDIFVVQDESGTLRRVQVKTAQVKAGKNQSSAQFSVSFKQLMADLTQFHYVFMVRVENKWRNLIIIRQDYLKDFFINEKVGSVSQGKIIYRFAFKSGKVFCSGRDLSFYENNYDDFPLTEH